MKIALVKQEVYQDLYVCNNRSPIEEILFSSQGRVGPWGLFSMYDADFYIVKEENTKECNIWTKIIPGKTEQFRKLKHETINNIKGMEFHIPGSDKPNGYYAVDCYDIDWSEYDIVISINFSIPTKIVQKYTNTLWAYMIGEANFMQDKVYFGYDVSLNQLIQGNYDRTNNIIDFPYTFVGPNCLEDIIYKKLNRKSFNNGIYGEINTTTERPVKRIPQFEPISEVTNQPIKMHKQKIDDNLIEIYDSKYYLKIGGRKTRGNGAIEAISLGTLVLMSPDDIICGQILPPETWVFNTEDAINKIKYLDNNPKEYERLLNLQRDLLNTFVVKYPIHYLNVALENKRNNNKPNKIYKYSDVKYITDVYKKIVKRIKQSR